MGHQHVVTPDFIFEAMGFSEDPFKITPDIDYVFPVPQHADAVKQLEFAAFGGGLAMLVGEVGLGKTLICRKLLDQLSETEGIKTAYLINPAQNFAYLLSSVIYDLTGARTHTSGEDYHQLIEVLNRVLLQEAEKGNRVFLIVDEAHSLSVPILEGIRMLTNLETSKDKLLSILLVGQPELEETLKMREMRQFNQRIAIRYKISPLNRHQTYDYVNHRLSSIDGQSSPMAFSGWAMRWLYHYTKGVPRRINLVCSRALIAAFADYSTTVSSAHIRRAAKEIDFGIG